MPNPLTEHPLFAGAAGLGAIAAAASLWSQKPPSPEVSTTEKYRPGDDYTDNAHLAVDVVKELRKAGVHSTFHDIKTLLTFAFTAATHQPVDDRELMMEKVIAVVTKLPQNSKARRKLTGILITGLWNSLDHPPLTFQGPEYQYRRADGSYNNILNPQLGAAKTPYAKSIRTEQKLNAARPDPGVLFDSLMARDDSQYEENPAGLSSMLFYHATIITHDIFRSSHTNPNISDTSSYLDLASLYGNSVADQKKIRAFEGGKLLPDTYFEERLLAQPPGVNVMLVLYSRYHNFVADMLSKINEGGRFNLKPVPADAEDPKMAAKAQDEDLFQTARLVVNGLYINVCLHDYLRALTNTHHSDSTWTLDPRVEIPGSALKSETARGIGNQVSTEFNLMYRFHSVISQKDEKWFEEFFAKESKLKKPLSECTPREVLIALQKFEGTIDEDPSKRTFAGLQRGADGKFADADLARVLKECMDDTAGRFGPRHVPKSLRAIEMMGINRARQWNTASLNEFRKFFGLKPHETFEDINPDPEIVNTLRGFYGHPDLVEAYPAMWLEDGKPRMDPGQGACVPYTVGRAIFSDAVTLVRSDRYYTIDYTAASLTNWGFTEVQQDLSTMGGSMMYKLIQRGLPGWFAFNSVAVMQPFFSKKMNAQIATELGTIGDFTQDDPKTPPKPKIVTKASTARKILTDSTNFVVPWGKAYRDLNDGHDYSHFMLSGDAPANVEQKKLMHSLLFKSPDFKKLVSETTFRIADKHIKAEMFSMGKDFLDGKPKFEVDLVRDVAIPTLAELLSDIFCLGIKTDENPIGTYNAAGLTRDLLALRTWGFANFDPAQAWRRRREAREAADRLRTRVVAHLKLVTGSSDGGLVSKAIGYLTGSSADHPPKANSLRWHGINTARQLLAAGNSYSKTAEILFLSALGGIGSPISQFTESYYWLTQSSSTGHAAAIQSLVSSNAPDLNDKLEKYILEAERMTSLGRVARVVKSPVTVDGVSYSPSDAVILLMGVNGAAMDSDLHSNPSTFDLTRPRRNYLNGGYGSHECLGREISLSFSTALLHAATGLQLMTWAPGTGVLRPISAHNNRFYLSEDGAHLTSDPTTLKCHFRAYTHDRGAFLPLPPIPKEIMPPSEGKVERGLRPSDIAEEKKYLIETGSTYTKEEIEVSYSANAPPGAIVFAGGDGGIQKAVRKEFVRMNTKINREEKREEGKTDFGHGHYHHHHN
ncbi:unnamed protein product [Zymoseptoria tritici ST99CH_1A5]|uniref:Linoleate 8R-lipoxygenase n=3 Tax=Zymoseptoria tritici TaxID=1047171 RepID=F9XA92_ZYMTI|nr:uncharacterized protein MYCGRDRAFT_71165 [Zymoseptoria tritici IPO323]EGP87976.1 hypothetical protein MYCGRDRAFT_71165 [Zymoseptoria tritici IPO323]SMR50936.1 unnamed protein product [Zymoseptoria tritici ST99CH_1E4]SMY23633.1 unnamed protein product [Zymoseptoria tritici ST99CH_1A5]